MENCINYIKLGVKSVAPSFYVKQSLSLFILAFLSLMPGVVLGGFWMVLFVIMMLLAIGVTLSVLFLKSKYFKTKNDLIMQTIVSCGWTFELVLLECVFISNLLGVRPYLLLLFLQPFIVPTILAFFNDRALKAGKIKSKKGGLVAGGSAFGLAGIVGLGLGKTFFKDASQPMAVTLVVCCSSFLILWFSVGLISIHKLYYLNQYEKKYGPFPD